MSWEDIAREMESDKEEGRERLRAASLRAEVIDGGWKPLWNKVISYLREDVRKLNDHLHGERILQFTNDLTLISNNDLHFTVSNPAFPMIQLEINCEPKKGISITGGEFLSGQHEVKQIPPQRFDFDVDQDFIPCLADEERSFHPKQVAERVTEIAMNFFRKAADR